MGMGKVLTLGIFLIVMILLKMQKVDSIILAMGSAMTMAALYIMPVDAVTTGIDFNTIGVLIGMIIFLGIIKKSGLFEYLAIFIAKKTKGDAWKILLCFTVVTVALSGILDNVTTVLLIVPMTLIISRVLKVNPVPFIIAEIVASNIGGVLIAKGYPPLIILIVTLGILYWIYGKKLNIEESFKQEVIGCDGRKVIKDGELLKKGLIGILLIVIGVIMNDKLGVSAGIVALTCVIVMLCVGKKSIEEVVSRVEWTSIFFLMGLLVVVGGLEEVGIVDAIAETIVNTTIAKPIAMVVVLVICLPTLVKKMVTQLALVDMYK